MAKVPEWRWFTIFGLLMIIQTVFDVAPDGPWSARSFTRGVIGLCGLCCLYIGWFRFTFQRSGIIPSINRWKEPKKSWKYVILFSVVCLLILSGLRQSNLIERLPETTGMIILLIASLSMLNGIYVSLVVSGPLSENSEEE